MLVVAAVRFGKVENWSIIYTFRECLQLYTSEFEIVHGFRQKNMIAD